MAAYYGEKWLTSKEVLLRTSISRATLNNYIKMGIIPKPVVKRPVSGLPGTKKIGYFPEEVVESIETVKRLKQEGNSMEEIARRFVQMPPVNQPLGRGNANQSYQEQGPSPIHPEEPETGTSKGMSLKLTIDDIPHAALLVNQSFEIEWINNAAEEQFFNRSIRSIPELESRNIFKLFFTWEFHDAVRNWKDVVAFHMAFCKDKFTKDDLAKLYEGISASELGCLEKIYEEQSPLQSEGITNNHLKIEKQDGSVLNYQVYSVFFREGMFFVYVPTEESLSGLLEVISCRESVINDLLKRRMPSLVSLCVFVADLQDSVKISAELPPSDYFELINGLWKTLQGCFEKYNGICGKHAGDGILQYFIKRPGTNYIMDAICCAVEVREKTRAFSNEWKLRKGWLNDLYLNVGINEGKEYFGTIQSSSNIEFTALGDSINYTGRLSDLARFGSIMVTKNVINRLDSEEISRIRYGIRRRQEDGREIFIEKSFSRVLDLLDTSDERHIKFRDISTLPVTEIIDTVCTDRENGLP